MVGKLSLTTLVVILSLCLPSKHVAAALTCKVCEFYRTSTAASDFYDVSGVAGATELVWTQQDEDSSKEISLPWSFSFFAGTYSKIGVNENGYIAFGDLPSFYQNKQCPFDNRTLHRFIAPMWTDLIADGATGHVHLAKYPSSCPVGNSVVGCVIVQWVGVVLDPSLVPAGAWQAVLYSNGDIALDYQTVGTSLSYSSGIQSDLRIHDYFILACSPANAATGAQPSTRYLFEYDTLKDCPNGVCNTGENCLICNSDCPKPCGLCGDGNCSAAHGETCDNCPLDCKCCGDGFCSAGECGVCLQDCTQQPCCGDGECTALAGETTCSCPSDCPGACCGDGECSTALNESCLTCVKDCIGEYCHANDPYTLVKLSTGTWLAGADGSGVASMPTVNASAVFALLPFAFPLYNHFFDWVVIGSRGVLWFGAGVTSPPVQQCPLVNTGTPYVIAPFWAGLYFTSSSSKIRYWNATNCDGLGSKCFVVQFDFMGVPGTVGTARVQVMLLSNGNIHFNYNLVPATTKVTVGIKGGTTYSTSFGYNLLYCDAAGTRPASGESFVFTFAGCGDGVCSPTTENCVSCPGDCPRTADGCGMCGDGKCDANETCGVCIADCGKAIGDSDNDGTPDCDDGCPYDPLKTAPGKCGCGIPDKDTDNDGTVDCEDACPTNKYKWLDAGVCGCQAEDKDTDKDGVLDCLDACPTDPNKNVFVGWCGCGRNETNTDGDSRPDCVDECPTDPSKIKHGFCGCFLPETDTDNDGYPDCVDECINDPAKHLEGVCGCGVPDIDSDNDTVPDCVDPCPTMAYITPTRCGCNVTETPDTDNDGAIDCIDKCPHDPKKTVPGFCGCGNLETDTDKDGAPDCIDKCPLDPLKNVTGVCGCGVPDKDNDNDGAPDCVDPCPLDPNVWENPPDRDNDGTPDCKDGCPDDGSKVTDVDSDGDGVPDCADKCPADNLKTAPLFCGCGAVDPASTAGLEKSPIGLSLTARKRDITCAGMNDGSITALAAGGTGRYNYTLVCSTAATKATTTTSTVALAGTPVKFAGRSDGACSLQVLDGNRCLVTWPVLFTFTSPSVLNIASEKADAGACSAGASFVVAVTGGLAPHTFSMLGAGYSQTSGAFSGLPAGEYQCIVTDSRGCTVKGSVKRIEQWDSSKCSPASTTIALQALVIVSALFAAAF